MDITNAVGPPLAVFAFLLHFSLGNSVPVYYQCVVLFFVLFVATVRYSCHQCGTEQLYQGGCRMKNKAQIRSNRLLLSIVVDGATFKIPYLL